MVPVHSFQNWKFCGNANDQVFSIDTLPSVRASMLKPSHIQTRSQKNDKSLLLMLQKARASPCFPSLTKGRPVPGPGQRREWSWACALLQLNTQLLRSNVAVEREVSINRLRRSLNRAFDGLLCVDCGRGVLDTSHVATLYARVAARGHSEVSPVRFNTLLDHRSQSKRCIFGKNYGRQYSMGAKPLCLCSYSPVTCHKPLSLILCVRFDGKQSPRKRPRLPSGRARDQPPRTAPTISGAAN
jgi:hypothetical protein